MKEFYAFFQQEPSYFVDKSIIRKKYLEQIKNYQNEQNLEQLSLLHTAYKTLMDDELRLEYLLKLWKIIDNDDNNETKLSNEFLLYIMDLNESIELGNENAFNDAQKLLDENFAKILQLLDQPLNIENKKQLSQLYSERKYLKRIIKN
jgi:DnaJ-domain-containing protein 1